LWHCPGNVQSTSQSAEKEVTEVNKRWGEVFEAANKNVIKRKFALEQALRPQRKEKATKNSDGRSTEKRNV